MFTLVFLLLSLRRNGASAPFAAANDTDAQSIARAA